MNKGTAKQEKTEKQIKQPRTDKKEAVRKLLAAAKEKGLVGLEGKDYVVKDGDVILFRFNV